MKSVERIPLTTLGTRAAGYRDALLAAGIEPRMEYLTSGGFRREDATESVRELMSLSEPPTAIIAFDSILALGAMLGLRSLGLRCPDDVSLIGFDDAEWAEVVSPSLSVLRQPVHEIGVKACELLLRRIADRDRRHTHHRLRGTLVPRGSTAPPALSAGHPTTSDDGSGFDARQAAALLERTHQQAQQRLTSDKPLLSVFSALLVLAIYGSIWSSARGQHPYRGPSLDVVGVVYVLVAVAALVSVSVYVRATAGVSGRSRREARTMAVPVVAAIVGVYVVDGALRYDGFSNSVVYGVFDAAAPWLVVGAVLAGHAAAREDRWKLAGAVAMIVVAAGSAFAGPANVWGVLGVCGFLLLLAQGVLRLQLARRGSTAGGAITSAGGE